MKLKIFKNSKIYYYFLRYLIMPCISLFWHFILNIKSFLLGVLFRIQNLNSKYIDFEHNTKKLIKDDQHFNDIASYINLNISSDFIEKRVSKIRSENYKMSLSEKNQAMALNPFIINLFPELDKEVKKRIIKFATSKYMIKTVTKYLGVFPMLARIYVNLNIPTSTEARSSQLWHRDDFGYKNLDLFLAINDINDENGPLFSIKNKDPLKIFFRVKKEINSGLTGERGKILDKDFNYLLSKNKNETIKLEGKKGTGLWIDSIRNYHKGGHCKSNYRLVLRINYMTPDSTFDLESKNKEKSEWFSLLDDKNKKNFFIKQLFRNRSIFLNKFKIPELLFKFYHMVSIKK
tara:strand:- start:39 stop:1079 length:1041 start_codon:yes stop_codon:yes gene_type:complete